LGSSAGIGRPLIQTWARLYPKAESLVEFGVNWCECEGLPFWLAWGVLFGFFPIFTS